MNPEKDTSVDADTENHEVETEDVELHEATNEEVKAALQNAIAEERAQAEAEAAGQPSQTNSGEKNPNNLHENPQNNKPAEQPSGQGQGVASPGASTSQPASQQTAGQQDTSQDSTANTARLNERLRQKELFIQHRGTELGTLKSQIRERTRELEAAKAQLQNGLQERFSENPVQAANDRDSIKDIDAELQNLQGKERQAEQIVEAQTLFMRHIDTDKVSPDDIAEVFRSEGMDERYIAQFKANPWTFMGVDALIQVAKRAEDRKNYIQADTDRRTLAKHVIWQNQEIERLKGKSGQTIKNIQKNLNASPGVTAASSVSSKGARTLSVDEIHGMSDKEVKRALKEAMDREGIH